jgi:hypothetical protein
MKLICKDGQEREFISLFDLYVQKGFDPALLTKDDGLLSMSNPPDASFLKMLQLAKLGVSIDAYFWHYSWIHRKVNPVSIALDKVMDGYKWIALSPAFKWESENQIVGIKLGTFTLLVRVISKFINLLFLRFDEKKMYASLIYPVGGSEFQWSTGYEYIGILFDFNFKEKLIHLKDTVGNREEIFHMHPSIFGWTMRVFVSK